MNQKFLDVLKHEGVVAIVTSNNQEPHVVNTWNSYIQIEEDTLLIPAGRMHQTQENLNINNHVLLTVGSKEVDDGCGFLIKGQAQMIDSHPLMSQSFPWARKILVVKINEIKQTL